MADPEGEELRRGADPAQPGHEVTMTERPDHELEVLEDDQSVPPRPEELIADAARSEPDQTPEP